MSRPDSVQIHPFDDRHSLAEQDLVRRCAGRVVAFHGQVVEGDGLDPAAHDLFRPVRGDVYIPVAEALPGLEAP